MASMNMANQAAFSEAWVAGRAHQPRWHVQ